MLLLAGVVFCFAGIGVACSAVYLWDVSKKSAILVVSANFVESVGAIFHPVREQ